MDEPVLECHESREKLKERKGRNYLPRGIELDSHASIRQSIERTKIRIRIRVFGHGTVSNKLRMLSQWQLRKRGKN